MFKVLPPSAPWLVRWVNLGDHTEGFRGSPAFTRWREIVGPFFRGATTGGARQRRRNYVNGRRNCVNVCRTAPHLLLRGAPPTPEAPLLALGVVLLLLAALATPDPLRPTRWPNGR